MLRSIRAGAASVLAACALLAHAAPFTPASDAEVVEHLPAGATDPSVRRVQSLRKQLAARPDDAGLRLEIARRYFDLAMAQGDPRYVGYATATLGPLEKTAPNDWQYWLLKGLLQQYSHDFDGALRSLDRASAIDPAQPAPVSWRAAIQMVQARYPQAAAECTKLAGLALPLYAQGCTAYVQAATGQLAPAYAMLSRAFAEAKDTPPELALWTRTRLAEMAIRLGRTQEAATHFTEASKLGITDQFLLGAHADFLLSQGKADEVIRLLADWERSDILLLRLALAGKAARHPKAADWASQLRDRFQAAAQRGDRLHEQEAARFELDVEGRTKEALDYAVRNYGSQKEARDAEILLRAALAAKQPKAAQPALDWLKASGYEDPQMAKLAKELAG